jgi:amino acid transporter
VSEEPTKTEADDELSKLGYAQELARAMGGFSSFAVSFSIISILTGIVTTYGSALAGGGPAALGLGWPLVAVGTMFVALAMAELASAFPTAGALYHWSAILGGPGYGWFTAALNLVGQCAIVAAIDLGCAREIAGIFGLQGNLVFLVYGLVLGSHAFINFISVRLVAWLNDLSAAVHIIGVLVLTALLWGARRHDLSFLADQSYTEQPLGYRVGFMNGLILGMYTFTGYDASAHLSEETKDPTRRAPMGILSSVGVSAVVGYIFVSVLTLAVGDVAATAKDEHAALSVLTQALGPTGGKSAMALAIFAMWFCGLSSVTSASRTLFAFARDQGLPGSQWLRKVHPTHKVPHVALALAVAGPLALVLVTSRLSGHVFDAMVSMATMGLYVSYGAPIALGLVARLRGRWTRMGPVHLGRFGIPVSVLALAWAGFVLFVSALPPNTLAAKLTLGLAVVLVLFYVVRGRGRFKGPPVGLEDFESRTSDAPTTPSS